MLYQGEVNFLRQGGNKQVSQAELAEGWVQVQEDKERSRSLKDSRVSHCWKKVVECN